jgi:hypothetical protein
MINRTRSETFSWRTAVGQDICYYITYKRNWFSFIWSNQIIITSINSVVSSSVVSTQTQVRLNHVLKTRIVRSWHLHCCSPCITNKTIQYKFSQSENQNRSSKTEITWVYAKMRIPRDWLRRSCWVLYREYPKFPTTPFQNQILCNLSCLCPNQNYV